MPFPVILYVFRRQQPDNNKTIMTFDNYAVIPKKRTNLKKHLPMSAKSCTFAAHNQYVFTYEISPSLFRCPAASVAGNDCC